MVRASKVKHFTGDPIELGQERMRSHSLACCLVCCHSLAGGREGREFTTGASECEEKRSKGKKNATVRQFTHSYRKSSGPDP